MYLLDTDIIIYSLKGNQVVVDNIRDHADCPKAISVITYGEAEQVTDNDEKTRILNVFMKKYTGKEDFAYNLPSIKNVQVYKVKMRESTAKTMGYN